MLRAAFDISPEHGEYEALKNEFFDVYAGCLTQRTQAFDGVTHLLASLVGQHMPWGVVTNKPRRYTEPLMAALQLSARATVVVSADEVPFAKPAPDALIEACRRAGLAPQRNCLCLACDWHLDCGDFYGSVYGPRS